MMENENEEERIVRWNDKLEAAARDIGEDAKAYKMQHISVARYTSKVHEVLMMTSIVLGPLAGTVSGIGVALDDGSSVLPIVATVTAFLSGIFVAIVKYGEYDEMSLANKSVAAKYTSLESNVRRQLAMYRSDRLDARKYLEWLTKSYDELFASAPLIPRNVQDAYAEHARSNGWYVPGQIDTMIDINTEYQACKTREVSNTASIVVQAEMRATDGQVSDDISLSIEPAPMKGENKMRRTNTLSNHDGLNRFNDGLMNYEMSRMMGIEN
jgi:hypothetical protein